MRPLLLDTNVLSELRKKEPAIDGQVLIWSRNIDVESCFLSVITLYELERGILLLQRKDQEQASDLAKWFVTIRDRDFKGRILPIDAETASTAATLQIPNPRSVPDALIAATALEHNLTLATRNIQDFLDTGTRLVNPWGPGSPTTAQLA
jgi:predicted nucleic acid-binding protein